MKTIFRIWARVFFVSTTCFSLLFTSLFRPQVSYAQNPEVVVSRPQSNPTPYPTAKTSYEGDQLVKIEGKNTPLYVNALNLLLMVFFGVSIPRYCTPLLRPSLIVYWLASLYYVFAEIKNFRKYQEESEKTLEYDMGGNFQKQRESFERARDITKEARKYAESKAKDYKILSIAFSSAAALAIVELIYNKLSPPGLGEFKCKAPKNLFGQLPRKPLEQFDWLENQLLVAETELDSLVLVQEWQRYNQGEIQSLSLNEYQQMQATYLKSHSAPEFKPWILEAISIAKTLIIPTAFAQTQEVATSFRTGNENSKNANKNKSVILTALGITGGALAAFVAGWVASADWIAKMLQPDWARSIFFGINAGLTLTTMKLTEKVVSDLEEREEQYNQVIRFLSKQENKDRVVASGNLQTIAPVQALTPQLSPLATDRSSCFSRQGNTKEVKLDEKCDCLVTRTCINAKPLDLKKSFTGFNVPKALQQANTDFTNSFNTASNGNLSRASSLQNAGQLLNAVRESREKLEEQANKILKKPLNFRQLEDKALKRISRNSAQAIQKAGGVQALQETPRFARIRPPQDLRELEGKLANNPEQKQPPIDQTRTKIAKETVGANVKRQASDDPFANLNFDDENLVQSETLDEASIETERALAEYQETTSDIVERESENIFKVISVRYMKTGYPRLLDETR